MVKNVKKVSKNLSGKYRQKLFDHTKQSATDALKTASQTVLLQNSRSNW